MTKRTLPGGQSGSFTYDAVGNVASHTTFKGDTITFTYDTLNRVATKTVPVSGAAGTLNNTTTYSYTPTGQVASVLDTRGTTTYSYDARDRLTQGVHPEGWTVTYGYDAAGNRSSISTQFSTEAAKTTSFEYDAANRLTRTTSAEGEITIFGYDAAGNRTSAALSNGTSIAWTYDARNRLTKVEHRKVANNALIASHTYTWNAQGLRSREVSLTTTSQFQCQYDHTYDALGRLTQTAVSFPGTQGNPCRFTGTWTYGYDAVGNRLTESTPTFPAGTSSFTYDVNDRLTSVTGKKQATYEYDAGGNVTKQTLPAPNGSTVPLVTQYQWDPENRLVGFTPAVGQGEPLSYLYDADGELVRQVRQAATNAQPSLADTTLYLPDKNLPFSQILEERDGSGALKASYQYADGQLVKEVQSGVETFYHSNHLSVMALTDSTGAVVNHYNYSPFGEITFQSATTPVNGHLFAGERFDANLALYYLRARWMDPRAGKFEATDPALPKLLNPKTLNTYAYAVGDPVNHIDRTGGSALLDAMGGQSGMMQIALPAVSFAAGVIGTITYATLEKEKAKAKDCISRMRGSAIGPRPCPNTLLPIVFMSADRMPTIAAHVALAQPPEILSRAGLGQNVRNRLVAIAKCALGGSINLRTALNNSCDEYPFASSIEGGIALTVSTMWVPIAEQWSQGGVLAAFYAYCNVLPGVPVMNVFGVLPVASSPTSFQCAFR